MKTWVTFNNKHNQEDGKMGKKNRKNNTPEPDGLDVEYSSELADHNDLEAQARAEAADKRAKGKRTK
ncbi:YfhD family protein [Anaerobacillus sp. MEB173]|uniref:YfhD family protein n=1 Tax=Anaerobacillus sp. MEB173 TaxID=3383345 RepID=UPI003F918E7D